MNDVVINKTQSIQRCIQRAREELRKAGDDFKSDYTRQDAAIHEYQQINLQIVEKIIQKESNDLLRFTEDALTWDRKRERKSGT